MAKATLILKTYAVLIRLIVTLGIVWFVVLALPLPDNDVVFLYAISNALVVVLFASSTLRARLSSSRAQMTPGFWGANIIGILALCGVSLWLSVAMVASRGLHPVGMALLLWSFSLLGWLVGYFVPAIVWRHPRLLLPLLFSGGLYGAAVGVLPFLDLSAFYDLIKRIGTSPVWILPISVINLAMTWLLVRRTLGLSEEAFEYFSADSRELTRQIYARRPAPHLATLETAQPPMLSGLASQLKHLQIGLFPGKQPSFLKMAACMTAVLLVLRIIVKTDTTPIFIGLAFGLPVGSIFAAQQNLKVFLGLPLNRRELVLKGGCALLQGTFRMWAACMVGIAVTSWSIPSVWPLLTSLVLQLPLFGALTLAFSVHQRWKSLLLLLLVPAVALNGVLSLSRRGDLALVSVVGSLVLGALLMRISYQGWCNYEVE